MCDFFSFKDNPSSILKFVRLATHAECRRLPPLLIVALVLFPPALPCLSSHLLLTPPSLPLALLRKCLSHNGMLGFLVSSTAWSWKADGELLGNEYRTDICTQESWGQVDFVLPDGVEVCSLLEWRCELWWRGGMLAGGVEV